MKGRYNKGVMTGSLFWSRKPALTAAFSGLEVRARVRDAVPHAQVRLRPEGDAGVRGHRGPRPLAARLVRGESSGDDPRA